MDKSSTNCHCSTLRPWGNREPNEKSPAPDPKGVSAVSDEMRLPGKSASAALKFGLLNNAEYNRLEKMKLFTTRGLKMCV